MLQFRNQLQRMMAFYAVARGHNAGIYDTWAQCEKEVKGFKGAVYKKFKDRLEAESFLRTNSSSGSSSSSSFNPREYAVLLAAKGGKPPAKQEPAKEEPAKQDLDFWPASDGDSFDEDDLTESDLLMAMAEVEGFSEADKKPAGQKRPLSGATTSERSSKVPRHDSLVWEPAGIKNVGAYEFPIDADGNVLVYTDGSCINNGRPDASAGFGVYFGDNHPLNSAQPVLGRVTNNVGEIQAAIFAIKIAKDLGISKLCINTDSQFLINAITSWVQAWKRKGWLLANGQPVKNVVDFKELDELLQDKRVKVKWNYVKGHKGIKGNEMADKLAREGSAIYRRLHKKS